MSNPVWPMLAAERSALAEYLPTLSDNDWKCQSPCTGWTLHDLVAYGDADRPALPTHERFVASAVASDTRFSLGTRPRETQLYLSAHTSIGGNTTSALSSAIATLSATIWPKSCRSGNDEVAITATPEIAVSEETMNARPVRAEATSIA